MVIFYCREGSKFFPGRIIVDILTLGLGEISRATAGSSNHWAFVAKASTQDNEVSLLMLADHSMFYFRATIFILWPNSEKVTSSQQSIGEIPERPIVQLRHSPEEL